MRKGPLLEPLDKNNKNGNEASTGRYGLIISKQQFSKVEISLNAEKICQKRKASTVISLRRLGRLPRVDIFRNSHMVPFRLMGHIWKIAPPTKSTFSKGSRFLE